MGACVCAHTDAYSSPPMCGHTHCYGTLTTLWSRQSPIGHLVFVLFVCFRAHFLSRCVRVAKHICEFSCVPELNIPPNTQKQWGTFLALCVQLSSGNTLLSKVFVYVSILPCNCPSKLPVRDKFVFKWQWKENYSAFGGVGADGRMEGGFHLGALRVTVFFQFTLTIVPGRVM